MTGTKKRILTTYHGGGEKEGNSSAGVGDLCGEIYIFMGVVSTDRKSEVSMELGIRPLSV